MLIQFEFLRPIFDAFAENDKKIYLVGGCVRDYLIGFRKIKDFDLCTDALPDETKEILGRLDCNIVDKNGGNFGTIHCVFSGQDVEITTFRKNENYPINSRRPDLDSLKFSKSLDDDLVRRDFTINALAMDLKGNLYGKDHKSHARDLEWRVLQSPQDPEELMRDDPLRILRMYRFAHRLGFTVSLDLRQAARNNAHLLKHVSRERIHEEFLKIAGGHNPHNAFREMMADGVMHQIAPGLSKQVGKDTGGKLTLWEHTLRVVKHMSVRKNYVEVLAALFYEGLNYYTIDNLKFSNKDLNDINSIIRYTEEYLNCKWNEITVRRFINYSGEYYDSVLTMLDSHGDQSEDRSMWLNRLDVEAIKNIKVPLTGEDVMGILGISPGPVVGLALSQLKSKMIDGLITDREQAVEFIKGIKV